MKKRNIWIYLFIFIGASSWFWFSLPHPLFQSPYSTTIIAQKGELLNVRIAADEQWRFAPIEKVPEKYAQAVIQYEDKSFYQHLGINPLAIIRALKQNIQENRIVSGASTITMQVIRLAKNNPERTLWEKIIEMILATRLELTTSKKEILKLYASHAPFGGNIVGLNAASWAYYRRSPGKLSWAEAATLAVLPN
ncbi:MAG: transglycosylase domain-containing protein, partial [Nitrospinae bacterium]|nr:transglycosylase domain-containing protein [Nitrospinota bacterium]